MAEVSFSREELREIAEFVDTVAVAGALEAKDIAEHIDMDELADALAEKLKREEVDSDEGNDTLSSRMDDLEDSAETAIRENDEAHLRALERIGALESQVSRLSEQLAKLEPVLRLVKKMERFLG
jgi:polyhydroxyalkanoate synthesis regulator phasin